jgi:hypothetical protein
MLLASRGDVMRVAPVLMSIGLCGGLGGGCGGTTEARENTPAGQDGTGGGDAGAGGIPSYDPSFRDVDHDGVPDPLVPTDFGDAGMAVTAEAFLAWRDRECAGWSAELEPLEQPCVFAMPIAPDGVPADTDQMAVMVWSESSDLILMLRNDSAECLDGWDVSDAGEFVFCASTCNQLSLHPEARVELLFGCESEYVEIV